MDGPERRLIEECLEGKPEAFGELIAPYQDRLYNALFRMTGHREDAAELFQEAMVRVFRGLRSYQGDSSFYTWLYRIVLNVAFTERRRKKSRPVSTESMTSSLYREIPDSVPGTGPDRRVEQEETKNVIEQALAAIAEPYRLVLVLKDMDGLKYEEIAEILDVPIGTVRSRLHRARSEMRERLQPYLDRGTI